MEMQEVVDPMVQRAWRDKFLVEFPRVLDGAEHTKFDKYKSSYMGRYNQVEVEQEAYAEFLANIGETDFGLDEGDRVRGTVAMIEGNNKAWLDVGGKNYALLPIREASMSPTPGESIVDYVTFGEEYEVEVIPDYDPSGATLVSLRRIAIEQAWEKLTELYWQDPVVDGTIVAVNRGGAIVLVEGLRAFCPGSHLMASGGIATEAMVGKKLQVKFLEVNKEQSKLVVSNKRATLEHAMDAVERGSVVKGVVTAVKVYGAFIEVFTPAPGLDDDAAESAAEEEGQKITGGSLSGLLHISQISYDRVTDIEATLHEGMELQCMILDYDKTNGRIALSTKTLEPEPGDMLRDPQRVFDLAHETAAKYHARIEAERLAREKAAQEMVLGLGDDLLGPDDDLSPSLPDDFSDSLDLDLDVLRVDDDVDALGKQQQQKPLSSSSLADLPDLATLDDIAGGAPEATI